MKVAILQSDIVWADVPTNLSHAETLIQNAGEADVYVLPEMFATGFATSPDDVAEPVGGPIQQWMASMAENRDAVVCGSVAVRDGVGCRNRLLVFMPGGQSLFYDKRHLFTYGGEHLHYEAGERQVDFSFRGVKFRLAVCYDIRFPAWLRNSASDAYDALIVVASWPTPRQAVWDVLLRARAIENQAYVIGVNRAGTDPVCTYSGGSAVIDAYGKTVVACSSEGAESVAVADLDVERLSRFRLKFPVLMDKDEFLMK